MADEALRLLTYEDLLSPREFESRIESRNIPAVFHGCIKHWKAFSYWNPSNGGLNYLQEKVGEAVVEAMLSRSAPVFYGDLRSHEMVPIPFSKFITSCKQCLSNTDAGSGVCAKLKDQELRDSTDESCSVSEDSHYQVYLAQVPIMNFENKERSQLEILRDDIDLPKVLESRELTSINLWMNNVKSRSSTHYDPHHNLLCVVSGCKRVVLWPPSASPLLYLRPVYGEASNHSSVDLENPDYSIHSRAKHSLDYSQNVTLHAGDALFIPEGWFHQVDSDDLTIAVNYWWQSRIMSAMLEHMDAYYLRTILRRLVNNEMDHMLAGASVCNGLSEKQVEKKIGCEQTGSQGSDADDHSETHDNKNSNPMLHQLKPPALQALHELISLVHNSVNVAPKNKAVPSTSTDISPNDENKKISSVNSFCLEDDSVAYIFWSLEALELRNVLLAMAHNFPRTLETLVLHVLSPVGAEILTRRFEEIDKLITKEEGNEFYQKIYRVFDDQFQAMDSILNGKESFAFKTFRNVLYKYLGVQFDTPEPSI
ncbi:hypothetical protein ACHQM5_014608 [Ranunculus cassubicifolius]